MENQFDFYVVKVSSPRKRELLKAGVAAGTNRSEVAGYVSYGRNRYPRREYVASVGYVDVCPDPESASHRADDIALAWRAKGLSTAVRYIARD